MGWAMLIVGMLGIGLIAAAGPWLPTTGKKDLAQSISSGRSTHPIANHWERQPDLIMTEPLASAVEIAARSVGAGTDDFFSSRM